MQSSGEYEMISTIIHMPPMPMKFDPNLLSMPAFGFRAEYLYQISAFLQKKIDSAEFRKFPATIQKLKQKQQQFMELYERAKIKEEQAKTKTRLKTQWLGYRPRLANKNDQRVFDRLNNRAETSKLDRRHSKVRKIREVK